MRTRTISQPSGMEVRPHSRPKRTGTVIDSRIGHQRSRDIRPDTDEESNLQRLINKRAQQLKEYRQSLNDRLERYVQLRATQHWTSPTHSSYNLFDARLHISTRGHIRRECHHPNLWQSLASFFEVHIHPCTKQNFFPSTNSFV